MHLGNARTALLAWLQVRALGGTFLLRIEDLDTSRARREHVDALLRDLEYLGLDWDEPPLYQSERRALYADAVATLAAAGLAYPCFCSRAKIARELANAPSAPHGPSEDGPRYPGTCAALSADEVRARRATRTPAMRFRASAGFERFDDQVHGAYAQDVRARVGDFVITRADGVASYQLAVVVDDAETNITHVLRADDLLSSTPRQLQLYRALGRTPPRFAHVPLVLGTDGKRLAKRDGAYAISELRERGVDPRRVIGLLAAWSGLGAGEPTSATALIPHFALEALTRKPAVAQDESSLAAALGIA